MKDRHVLEVSPTSNRGRSSRGRLLRAGVLLSVVVAGTALVRAGVFGESAEHVISDETPELRAPTGELLPPVGGRSALIWAVGDADDGAEARILAATVIRARPDRVLYLGDVYEFGNAASFRTWSQVWGTLASRTAPTPGNHEWAEGNEGYDPYWRRAHGRPVPSYYSLRAGGWEILSLNSEAAHEAGSEQERWLAGQVARRSGDCRIVFWHRPRHSAGPRGDEASLEPLWQHLPRHARVLLGGHEHNLQRLRPRDGVTQFVVGAGGRGHAPVDRAHARLAFADDRRTGALRMALRPGRLTWQFVAAGGSVMETGSLGCSPLGS